MMVSRTKSDTEHVAHDNKLPELVWERHTKSQFGQPDTRSLHKLSNDREMKCLKSQRRVGSQSYSIFIGVKYNDFEREKLSGPRRSPCTFIVED